ncbi:MAG: cytochrome c3 family protein [Planctomycetota bacterium]
MTTTPRRLKALWPLLAPLLIFIAACSTYTAQQDWWSGNGPVIPHDNFPAKCSLCHDGSAWNKVRSDFEFDHEAETGVALSGSHQNAQCLRCHNDRGPVAEFASMGCAGCHEDVHLGKLGQECTDCHGELNWAPQGQIAEHSRYGFALVGAHAATSCFRCHEGFEAGVFTPTDSSCESCHEAPSGTVGGGFDHLAQGLVNDCQRCHSPTNFKAAGFDHAQFPLTGRHTTLNCSDCHTDAGFLGLSADCFSCHSTEFLGTTNPNHVVENFPMTCQNCHGTNTWSGATFNHAQISSNCSNCHMPEYLATTSPDHNALGFSIRCEDCHGTNMWQGASFDHQGITTNCADCHLPAYNSTTNPDHVSAGFPTTCENCHTNTNNWNNANFNHDFPITSGKHSGFDCADCHINGFGSFSCTVCHSAGATNGKHDGVSGYAYNTAACYSCHPSGRE